MSGTHSVLKTDCEDVADKEGLEFVLGSQYIRISERLAKVVIGSGMGEEHSGAVSDWSYFKRAEERFILCSEMREKYGILYYVRYRDDSLFVIDWQGRRVEFWNELKSMAQPFSLSMESLHLSSCVMLDLEIYKGPRWHRSRVPDIRMFFKPTSQGVPLSHKSDHHSNIHSF